MFDYETLRFIWWLLIGVILVVFMISDGFDMGIGWLRAAGVVAGGNAKSLADRFAVTAAH